MLYTALMMAIEAWQVSGIKRRNCFRLWCSASCIFASDLRPNIIQASASEFSDLQVRVPATVTQNSSMLKCTLTCDRVAERVMFSCNKIQSWTSYPSCSYALIVNGDCSFNLFNLKIFGKLSFDCAGQLPPAVHASNSVTLFRNELSNNSTSI